MDNSLREVVIKSELGVVSQICGPYWPVFTYRNNNLTPNHIKSHCH